MFNDVMLNAFWDVQIWLIWLNISHGTFYKIFWYDQNCNIPRNACVAFACLTNRQMDRHWTKWFLCVAMLYHTVQPNRTLYRIHHIRDRQPEGLLRIKFVIYGTPFQHIFNYLKISSIIWGYILYLQIFEDIFNSYKYIFK